MTLHLAPDPPPAPLDEDDAADAREELARSKGTRLSAADLAECDRWSAIAAWYVRLGVRPLVAWARANEWVNEHGAELPEGMVYTPDPRALPRRAAVRELLVTPPERRIAPPADKKLDALIPDERPGDVDLDDPPYHEPVFARGPDLTPPSPSTRPAMPYAVRNDVWEGGGLADRVQAALAERPLRLAELRLKVADIAPGELTVALNRLRHRGLALQDGRGTPWRLPQQPAFLPRPTEAAPERAVRLPPRARAASSRVASVDVGRTLQTAPPEGVHERATPAAPPAGPRSGAPSGGEAFRSRSDERRVAVQRGEPLPELTWAGEAPVVQRDPKPEKITRDAAPAAPPRTKERPMTQEEVLDVLKDGEKSTGEIAAALGAEANGVGSMLRRMASMGLVVKAEGYGAPWSLTGKAPKTMADVVKKAAKKTAAGPQSASKKQKSNGHANGSNGAADPIKAAVAMLATALTEKKAKDDERFAAQLAALQSLAGDE